MKTNRRQFLRAAGVALALPGFESFGAGAEPPRMRTVVINLGLGLHAEHLWPQTTGPDYELTPYLKLIGEFRDHFTLISGTSHPDVDGGHASEKCFLTAAPHPASASFKNNISLDQLMAEHIGSATRFGHLNLALGSEPNSGGLSWSRAGVRLPSESRASVIFTRLFLEGRPDEKQRQLQRLRDGRSILDTVRHSARGLERRLGSRDREKLDQYLTVVRETEQRILQDEEWERRPKPKVNRQPPRDITDKSDIIGRTELLYDLIHLALQSDSTRVVTLASDAYSGKPKVPGAREGYHALSHHGRDPDKLRQLTLVESAQIKAFGGFLKRLNETVEKGTPLLDRTQVLLGSNLGNASSHNTRNLPIILAGGGYRHGRHLAFDAKNNEALPKLFTAMLQRMGMSVDSFAGHAGTLPGLELKA